MADPTIFQPATGALPPGTQLNGIYEIDTHLASGGMGDIYRGHELQTGDPVAIKVIRADMADNEAALALFRREASALNRLHHEAIVRYFVFSLDPVLRRHYLAMELVEGLSLGDMLRSGPLSVEQAHGLLRRVASGLAAAHERGIIHRDISPDNIIVSQADVNRARIIDFGIARSTRIGDGTVIGGGFAGKYNYVSPEQLGLFEGDVTGRSDIYSLGLVIAQSLLGKAIDMGGSQVEIIDKRRRVPDLSAIDARIRPTLEQMLQPNPADRPASMADVAAMTLRAPTKAEDKAARQRDKAAAQPVRPAPVRPVAGASQPKSGGGKGLMIAAGLVALAGAGGVVAWLQLSHSPAPVSPRPPQVTLDGTGGSASGGTATLPPQDTRPDTPALPGTGQNPTGQANAPPESAPPSQPPGSGQPTITSNQITEWANNQAGNRDPATAGPAPGITEPVRPPVQPPAPPVRPDQVATNTTGQGSVGETPIRPPVPTPPLSAPSKGIEQITQYIRQYDAGDCVLLMPGVVTAAAADIEGFGADVKPFDTFDEAFKKQIGWEAQIGVRMIKKAQCPALSFVSRLRGKSDSGKADGGMKLDIPVASIASGQILEGSLESGMSPVALVLVDDDGDVHDVTSQLRNDGGRRTFRLRLERPKNAPPNQPILLIALAGADLPALKGVSATSGESVFPKAIQQALAASRLSVAMKHVVLQ